MSHGVCAGLDAVWTLAEFNTALMWDVPAVFAVKIVVALPFKVVAGFVLVFLMEACE